MTGTLAVGHELLCRLAEINPEKARALTARHILDFDKYETDVEKFRATRISLLRGLNHLFLPIISHSTRIKKAQASLAPNKNNSLLSVQCKTAV
jgi:hypothetical protein